MDDEDEEREPQPGDEDEHNSPDEEPGADNPTLSLAFDAFRQQQRLLASFDFSVLAVAQQALTDWSAIRAMQESIAKSVAQSINFPALQEIVRSMQVSQSLVEAAQLHHKWAEDFAKSIDLSSIVRANERILSSTALWEARQQQQELLASISKHFDHSALTSQLSSLVERIDWAALRESIGRWLPENLRGSEDLESIGKICLDEGLPLTWVPRGEIVHELMEAKTAEDRQRILEERSVDILDDCRDVLSDISHDWANQCRSAISALRQPDLHGPAQSHAAGIIDSIVLTVLGDGGRKIAKQKASEPFDDLPLYLAVESLVLRPLLLGFAQWRPGSADPIPSSFARHATAHAVGQEGVFTRINALVAVMLATSLTVQFWNDPAAP